MKTSILILLTIIFLTDSCNRDTLLTLSDANKKQAIAFQPLEDYDPQQIQTVITEIGTFFNNPIIILKPIVIPTTYFNATVKMYCADSIVMNLSKLKQGNFVEVIGLTHKPLYTIKDHPIMPYYDTGILGFGYQPGNACVVTDNNFGVSSILTSQRLKNNILHEIGHNIGLSHCTITNCAMLIRNAGADYCKFCRSKLSK